MILQLVHDVVLSFTKLLDYGIKDMSGKIAISVHFSPTII